VNVAAAFPIPDASPALPVAGWHTMAGRFVRPVAARRRRGLLLDLDDTLYPREEFVQSGLLAVARHVEERYGLPALDAFATMSLARHDGRHGAEFQAMCAKHRLSPELIPALVEVFRAHRPVLRLPRRTADVLRQLRAQQWQLAVVTNGLPAVQRAKIAALKLAPLVDLVVYAEEHSQGGKPAPGPFRAALQRLRLPVGRCICVGDDPKSDIAGARALGMKTVRVRTGAFHVDPRDDADATVDTLDALPGVVTALLDMVRSSAA
jgi:putative hydrolase of the HAD superfamily